MRTFILIVFGYMITSAILRAVLIARRDYPVEKTVNFSTDLLEFAESIALSAGAAIVLW